MGPKRGRSKKKQSATTDMPPPSSTQAPSLSTENQPDPDVMPDQPIVLQNEFKDDVDTQPPVIKRKKQFKCRLLLLACCHSNIHMITDFFLLFNHGIYIPSVRNRGMILKKDHSRFGSVGVCRSKSLCIVVHRSKKSGQSV